MFGNKKTFDLKQFSLGYCDGFNAGISLLKKYPPDKKRESVKEVLHSMLQERNKDILFHGLFAGFSYQLEQVKIRERMEQIKEIENSKSPNKELER